MKTKYRTVRAVLLSFGILFFLLFLSFGTISAWLSFNEQKTKSVYDALATRVQFASVSGEEAQVKKEIPFFVDLSRLKAVNPDVIGWLYLPCLKLSYPLMYSGDNAFYLHRDFYRSYAMEGSLFLDAFSDPDLTDGNSLIYGHNMADGSMFGTLWKIPFQDAAKEDADFWIFTQETIYRYRIFSAFEGDVSSAAFKQYERGTKEFLSWCYDRKADSFISFGETFFRPDSRVVTLSTCGTNSRIRTFVMGYCTAVFRNTSI